MKIKQQTPDVWSIDFLVDGKPLPAEAGQYISVFFDETDVAEGKAYSLSSSPTDPTSQITVKRIGLFSGKLTDLKEGDFFTISPAYGFFEAFLGEPAVFIGQGVGISPLFSIICDEIKRDTSRTMELHYSNKTENDIIFHSELNEFNNREKLTTNFYITRQKDSAYEKRRFSVDDLKNLSDETCFYLCGTTDFTRSVWRQLVKKGVNENQISVEVFFGANDGN